MQNTHTAARLLNYLLIFCFISTLGQAHQREASLIQADSSWGKEVFQFPLSFAPKLLYRGFEEAWFPKGWANPDSASFWSYAFGWKIEAPHPLNQKTIEQNLRDYFDGLMSTNSGFPKDKLPPTQTMFAGEQKENWKSFRGKVQIYDAFTSKSPLILYVSIEQHFCTEQTVTILLFRFSPKPPKHAIWKRLDALAILGCAS